MTIDTFLLSLLMLLSWAWHWAIVATFFLVYIFISCAYLSSNLEKIPHGAWFSIVLSGILSVISYVYWWGTAKKASYVRKHAIPLTDLFEKSSGGRGGVLRVTAGAANMALPPLAPSSAPVPGSGDENLTVQLHSGVKPLRLVGTKLPVGRVPGLGLYYSELLEGVPPVLVRFLTLCPAIHETVVFVTVRRVLLPRVREDERLLVRKLEVPGFYHIVARYGYGESIDQGPAFVKMAVEEVVEYLAAGGIIDEIASETSDVADLEAAMASPRSQAESDAAPMSMNTVAGQRMLAAIRSRLRGEAAPAPEDPLSAENASSDASVRGKDEGASSVVATGTRLLVSSSMSMRHRSGRTSAASELSPRPGTPGKPNYPWVRQPTSFNRLGSAREKALDRVKALGGSWDSSATVPLPPPPPRPCIHRSSASGIVSDAVDAAVSTLVGTPSATMAGRAAADLGQQLKQARGAGKMEDTILDRFFCLVYCDRLDCRNSCACLLYKCYKPQACGMLYH